MDEQRLQAYQRLIQQLLSCPNGEEETILAANTELLDVGFLQMVVEVAGMFTQEGQENTANWLLALASQLSEYLNIPLDENTPETEPPLTQADIETYLPFLLQVLQTTAESKGNSQVVYPLLQANTDKLNGTFAQLLQDWATKTLEAAEPDQAKDIANNIWRFSNRIKDFSLGKIAHNIEIAIAGYKIASTVYTPQTSSENWAALQNNLATAYLYRIRGDKAENLENAIAACTAALEVYTRHDFPVQWAMTQNNLSIAYLYRIREDKAENLENAIAACTAALEVYTRHDFPVQWATTQNNLGNAYLYRIRGDKAENLESAIVAYTAALEVKTRHNFPVDWAMMQDNLGTTYLYRIRGDKAENLENAIAFHIAALDVRTRHNFPVDWATTQNNLGNAYSRKIRGDKAENLENAIAAFNAGLEMITRHDFPIQWAMIQDNLGTTYLHRIRGDKAGNLENAIAAYTAALKVRTCHDFPVDWAMTQNNLGTVYFDRIRGDKAENLENAIASHIAALEVYTRHDFPVDWAMTQNNLGNAYLYRIRGDKAENLENAIAAYTAALEVYTRNDFPQDHAETLLNLGRLYQDSQQLNLAYDTFTQAIATVEDLRGEIISGEESKRKQAERYNQLYRRMVEVCLALGKETEAITYIERSKTRNLVEQILSRDLENIFSSQEVKQLKELEHQISTGQNLIQTGKAENYQNLAQHLQQRRQQRQKLQDEYLPIGASFEFTSLKNIVDHNTAIIEWYIANDKFLAFVIQSGGKEIKIWQSSSADFDALFDWTNKYVNDYNQEKTAWENQLDQNLQNLAKILHLEEIFSN